MLERTRIMVGKKLMEQPFFRFYRISFSVYNANLYFRSYQKGLCWIWILNFDYDLSNTNTKAWKMRNRKWEQEPTTWYQLEFPYLSWMALDYLRFYTFQRLLTPLEHLLSSDFNIVILFIRIILTCDFRKMFGRVGDLLNQRKTVGEVAYLEHDGRYIFYLITKKFSYAKPNLETMSQALKSLRDHCEKLNVKKLAMPLIGCGLDKLRWEDVKQQLCDEFCQTDVEILVYREVRMCIISFLAGDPPSL